MAIFVKVEDPVCPEEDDRPRGIIVLPRTGGFTIALVLLMWFAILASMILRKSFETGPERIKRSKF